MSKINTVLCTAKKNWVRAVENYKLMIWSQFCC